VLALALALHHYLRLCAGAPTVLAGAYRHIATEAMHLVRRARFQVEDRAVRALLEVLEQAPALDEWLLDTWTLRLERALDLENEHGEKLVELTAGLPRVASMLRGDERIGWELRFAHDMADLAGLEGPAPVLLERVLRAAEAGAGALPWARLLLGAPPSPAALDAAWLTARAALHPVAWSALAVQAAAVGDAATATAAGQRAMRGASATDREAVVAVLSRAAVALGLPAVALARPVETAPEAAAVRAAEHLRAGAPLEALQVMAISDRASAPRRTGRMALEAGRHADALAMLRYAAHRFTRPDEWALLAAAAWHGRRPRVAVEAYQRYFDLGGPATPEMLAAHISMLTSVGRYAEATPWAHRLVEASRQAPAYRAIALGSMAAVLLGTGRYAEALKHAREARELLAGGDVRAIDELIERCTSRSAPARMADPDDEPERQAALALARGDVVTVRRLAGGVDATRGGVMAAALHAAVMRADADDTAALGAAATTLATTAGATNPGAVLARLLALRLREDAFILIDPSPPPSGPLDTVTFDAAFRARNEARRQRGEG
jgi:tetratricopeptide (TPR) repeat protein